MDTFRLPVSLQPLPLGLLFLLQIAIPAFCQSIPEDLLDDEHVREEMGVNEITAPSITKMIQQLEGFGTLDYEKLARPYPGNLSGGRVQLAMAFGNMIGDGCLIVATERSQAVEDYGRELLRLAKSLGVGDAVNSYSNSLLQFANAGDWRGVRGQLGGMQREVERTMVRYRDEEIAHLLSLGGWLRGLQMASDLVKDDFTPDKAARLVRRDLLAYYIQRLDSFRPGLLRHPLVAETLSNLQTIETLASVNKGKITLVEVTEISKILNNLNKRISGGK